MRNAQQMARRSDPEVRDKHNQEQNERRRRERRRRQLGLPPRHTHRATFNEREANGSAAHAFFSRRRGAGEIRLHREEQAEVRAAASLASDALWGQKLAARIRADATRPARTAAAVNELLNTEVGTRLREEVKMDSIARKVRGAESYPNAEAEVRRRALNALTAPRAALAKGGVPAHGRVPKARQFGHVPQRTGAVRPGRTSPSI